MKMYDIHSHLGKTSSGEENTPDDLVRELAANGVTKVRISSLSGISTRQQNDLIYKATQAYPEVIMGYGFINPKDGNALNEVDLCLGSYGFKAIKFHSW